MKTNNKGFSLVELIVVIAIMAILAAVAIPTFASFITKANVAADESYLNDLEYAVELALTAEGKDFSDYELTVYVEEGNNVTYVYANGTDEHEFTTEQDATIAATVELTHKFKSQSGVGSWKYNSTTSKWDFTANATKPTTTPTEPAEG